MNLSTVRYISYIYAYIHTYPQYICLQKKKKRKNPRAMGRDDEAQFTQKRSTIRAGQGGPTVNRVTVTVTHRPIIKINNIIITVVSVTFRMISILCLMKFYLATLWLIVLLHDFHELLFRLTLGKYYHLGHTAGGGCCYCVREQRMPLKNRRTRVLLVHPELQAAFGGEILTLHI